jgi:MFS family permease
LKYYTGYTWFITPHWLRRFGPLKLVKTPLLDRIALHYFTLYASLNAVLAGVFTLNNVVLRKALGATELEIGLISAVGAISLLMGIFGSEAVSGRPKQPFILYIGMLSRASILLFLFCKTYWVFFLIFTLYDILSALLMPPVFGFWQQNISERTRNQLWGVTVTISTVVSMASAYVTGIIYDIDPMSFRWVLAVAGLLGMLGTTVLAFSPGRGHYKFASEPVPYSFHSLVIQPVRSFYDLMKRDKWFASYEKMFAIYGFAVMMLFPLMPLYVADIAKMSYEQAGFTFGVLGQIGVIVCSPMWGVLMDRIGPIKTSAVVFGLLMLFPATLLLGMLPGLSLKSIHWFVYVGHVLYGIAMSGVSVTWSLGPMVFAGENDPSPYAGAHVTTTGIRGCVFPMLGALGIHYFGYQYVLAASFILFGCAMTGMYLLDKRYRAAHQFPRINA